MKRKVKAWVAVDDNGDPMFTSVYKGFYAVLEENVPGKTIPCTISYDLPTKERKRKASK